MKNLLNPLHPARCFSKFIAPFLALLFCIHLFTFTANAVSPNTAANAATANYAANAVSPNTTVISATTATTATATPEILINALAHHLHLPADLDALVDLGYITPTERNYLQVNKSLSMGTAWRILLPAYGIYPYPAEFYRDLNLLPDKNYHDPNNEAYIAAILSGLASVGHDFPSWTISRESLIALIEQLESGNYLPLDNPPFTLPDFAANVSLNHQSYQYRNSAMLAAYFIPRNWLVQFQTDGWQIICQWQPESELDQHAKYFQKMEEHGYTGLTVFANKTIYLIEYDFRTLAHELTHYTAYKVGWTTALLRPCYEAEASQISSLLSTYSQTAPEEYFAEFVAYWFKYPERQEALTTNAPETAKLLRQLLKDFEALSNR